MIKQPNLLSNNTVEVKLKQLNESDRSVFDNIISSLTANVEFAKEYSNRRCGQCVGKGYFEIDQILPKGVVVEIDGKPSRATPKERNLCFCVSHRVIKVVQEEQVNELE